MPGAGRSGSVRYSTSSSVCRSANTRPATTPEYSPGPLRRHLRRRRLSQSGGVSRVAGRAAAGAPLPRGRARLKDWPVGSVTSSRSSSGGVPSDAQPPSEMAEGAARAEGGAAAGESDMALRRRDARTAARGGAARGSTDAARRAKEAAPSSMRCTAAQRADAQATRRRRATRKLRSAATDDAQRSR